ncbi:MAG: glycoside hydrolase family 3 N-terminal domain-containing protein [Gammaproteobacteria bacterium]
MNVISSKVRKVWHIKHKCIFCLGLPVLLVSCDTGTQDQAGESEADILTFEQVAVENRAGDIIEQEGYFFNDRNGDGVLQRYEDWRLPLQERVADLIGHMTLEEKAGLMVHGTLPALGGIVGSSNQGYDLRATQSLMEQYKVSSFITRLSMEPRDIAAQNNLVQELAESSRLGIPVTISTDPRHHFQFTLGASAGATGFSQWPETLGFGALGDEELTQQFADFVRQDYRAVGIHMALSPQADIASEPRWPRQIGTFGSDAQLVREQVGAYVRGMQGSDSGLTADGVVTVVKHWVGYAAAPEGYDAHNYYGRFTPFTEQSIKPHIDAFRDAFDSGVAGVMPTYAIVQGEIYDGRENQPVGGAYSNLLLNDLLREELAFDGFILSDWGITRSCQRSCLQPTAEAPQTPQYIAMGWGVEEFTPIERFAKGIGAGIDQFGGTEESNYIVAAVEQGLVSESRINESVSRILSIKFLQGLFENPYVDAGAANETVSRQSSVQLAAKTQREAQVLLQNNGLLPLVGNKSRVFLFGMSQQAAEAAGLEVVAQPEQADFAIVRTQSPSEILHPYHFFGSRQEEGRLDFRTGDAAYDLLQSLPNEVPVVFSVFLSRPAILTNIQDKADVILANFGASDAAVLDVILGRTPVKGRLPFELPSSIQAVVDQDPALVDDTISPLYPFGSGL